MTSTGLPVGLEADAFWRFGCGSDGGPFSFFGLGAFRFFAGASSCDAPVAARTNARCRAWSFVRSCVEDESVTAYWRSGRRLCREGGNDAGG